MDQSELAFASLEQNARGLEDEAEKLLERLPSAASPGEKRQLLDAVDGLLLQLRTAVAQMTAFLYTSDPALTKRRAVVRRGYDSVANLLCARILHERSTGLAVPGAVDGSTSSGISSTRSSSQTRPYREYNVQLTGTNTSSSSSTSNGTGSQQHQNDKSDAPQDELKRQVLAGQAALQSTSDSLARSCTLAAESEAVGQAERDDLSAQREALDETCGTLTDTQQEASRAVRLARALRDHVCCNKILLSVIVGVEVVLLAGLVYWKFFSR